MAPEFINEVRQWFRDIRMMDPRGRVRMQVLAYAYNWATCPRTHRTDAEHRVCRAMARWMLRNLERHTGWHEMESGRLWA